MIYLSNEMERRTILRTIQYTLDETHATNKNRLATLQTQCELDMFQHVIHGRLGELDGAASD
jgi:hypothetical protein